MATPLPPGPPEDDGPRRPRPHCAPLSTREREALARIEADLGSDPDLAARMADRQFADAPLPRCVQAVVALAAGLLVVTVVPVLLSPAGLAVFGLMAVLVLVPWLLLRSVDRRHGDTDDDTDDGPPLR